MDLSTQSHLAVLRESLLYRLHELQTEVHAAERAARGAAGAGGEVLDRKDDASRRAGEAVGDAEERRDLDELAQVQAALQRLDAGVYGDCVDCGQPIALERLRVQPAAERCAACQAARERLRRA
ncbi:MAG TPA: TraR/DksA family transcriptional regulator [Methylibium sp.]|nr:TraR/DksA family transcriptional regulator [Methylibium sp.]